MFSEQDFLHSPVEGANSTQRLTLPIEGNPYIGVIKKLESRQSPGKKDPSKTYTFLDAQIDLELPQAIQAQMKRDSASVRYSMMLDLTDNGSLDMTEGANVNLGRLRKAVGQNDDTKPWKPMDLVGAPLKVTVTHRVDGEDTYTEVKSVEPL